MKKILGGLFGLTATLVVVGVAFALGFNQATVSGLDVNSADPNLQVSATTGGTFGSDYSLSALPVTNLIPGDPAKTETFALKNNNASAVNVTGQITLPASWDNTLAGAVQVAVEPSSVTPESSVPAGDWHSLTDWKASALSVGGGTLATATPTSYTMWVKIPGTFGAEVASKTISGIQFTFTGTP
jgi:hypothetical protein